MRGLVLILGLLVPQFILYGPSLVGRKVLLPLDLLALPGWYLPVRDGAAVDPPQNPILSDTILQMEMSRRFAVSEVRAGRLPLWNPYNYCGSPFLAANQPAVLSPYRLLDYLWDSPAAIAWGNVLKALVAGIGAYIYFRRAMRAGVVASTIGAWCWPLCGFLTLWAGFPISATATWLPWLVLAMERAVRRPGLTSIAAIALATAACLLSGHLAVAAHLLLASGLYFLGRLPAIYGWHAIFSRGAMRAVGVAVAGWLLGFMLAAPQVLPTLEYVSRSYRVQSRIAGQVETPPAGWTALAQLVLPHFYGDHTRGSIYFTPGNRLESAAAGYAGLLMTLVFAPLALGSRRHRGFVILWIVLAFISVSQILDVPLLSRIFALPPLNTLRNNRFVVVWSFAIVEIGVAGMDTLRRGIRWRAWFFAPMVLCLALGAACLMRLTSPPDAFVSMLDQFRRTLDSGVQPNSQIRSYADLGTLLANFTHAQYVAAGICAFALLLWIVLPLRVERREAVVWIVGLLMAGEMTYAAFGFYPQCDPALYYPRIPALEEVAHGQAGRAVGINCLPANLNIAAGLSDIRGYDAADPSRLVELLELFRDPTSSRPAGYAMTQWFVPRLDSPLLDMLGVKYLISVGKPPANSNAPQVSDDYWVAQNDLTLPRAFVPAEASMQPNKLRRLAMLADPKFDPRKICLVETTEPLPPPGGEGDAQIRSETPGHIAFDVSMKSPGVLVFSELFDLGWKATWNGGEIPVFPANHALNGVILPTGKGELVFTYTPASFTWGVRCSAIAGAILLLSLATVRLTKGTSPVAGKSTGRSLS